MPFDDFRAAELFQRAQRLIVELQREGLTPDEAIGVFFAGAIGAHVYGGGETSDLEDAFGRFHGFLGYCMVASRGVLEDMARSHAAKHGGWS